MDVDRPHRCASSYRSKAIKLLWNLGCVATVVGIWPRFIEPNLLFTTRLILGMGHVPSALEGLKIAQFSDLHLHPEVSERFLEKLVQRVMAWKPDIIVFTGDFLCYSQMTDAQRLENFLKRFSAPFGCYCIFGNHDYQSYVAVNGAGDYDVVDKVPFELCKGIKRLLVRQKVSGLMSPRLRQLVPHTALVELLEKTPFQMLENRTVQIKIRGSILNLCGVGEFMVNRCNPRQAFATYDERYPGIVLAHNPDCVKRLQNYPGEIILCGHVHGGQINLPWVRSRMVVLEDPSLVRGMHTVGGKSVHINRGLGSTLRFRLFAAPELSLITLKGRTS